MSEFINKSKIAELEKSNSDLVIEISNLKRELRDLNRLTESLRQQNPDETKNLKKRIEKYEKREDEIKENVLSVANEMKKNKKNYDVVKDLFSALKLLNTISAEDLIEQYYRKKWKQKIISAFILGNIVSLIAWIIFIYLENEKFYNNLIGKLIRKIYNYWL